MKMTLITLDQQQKIKTVSPNWARAFKITGGATNFEQLADEVENSELRKLLGVPLLQDLQANPTGVNNVILLDGGSYEDCNGNTINFAGIRTTLAYMNYSRIVAESFVSDTATGMVKKNRTEATQLSSGDIKRLQQPAQDRAMSEWELIKEYLDLNASIYPLWSCEQKNKIYNPRFTGLRRTIK